MESHIEGLAVVGHLHEITEESSEDAVSVDIPKDLNSFRKFLVSASQKHLKVDPSNILSSTST